MNQRRKHSSRAMAESYEYVGWRLRCKNQPQIYADLNLVLVENGTAPEYSSNRLSPSGQLWTKRFPSLLCAWPLRLRKQSDPHTGVTWINTRWALTDESGSKWEAQMMGTGSAGSFPPATLFGRVCFPLRDQWDQWIGAGSAAAQARNWRSLHKISKRTSPRKFAFSLVLSGETVFH